MVEVIDLSVGWLLIIMGCSYMFQAKQWMQVMDLMLRKPQRILPMLWVLTFMALLIVFSHSGGQGSWLVSMFGWLLLLKSVGYLMFTQHMVNVVKRIDFDSGPWLSLSGSLVIVLGIVILSG